MKDTIKTIINLLIMLFVIWWGMGHPIPTTFEEIVNLAIAIGATAYTGYKNFDFTEIAREYTGLMRIKKLEMKSGKVEEQDEEE